jgi:hypothetical protein
VHQFSILRRRHQAAQTDQQLTKPPPPKNKTNMKLNLVLIPVNSPEKGVDDVRAKLGSEFPAFFENLSRTSHSISGDESKGSLAIELAKKQASAIKELTGESRAKAEKNLINMAAMLQTDPLRQDEAHDLINDCLGHKLTAIKKAVRVARSKILDEMNGNASPAHSKSSLPQVGVPSGKSPIPKLPAVIKLPNEPFTTFGDTAKVLFPAMVRQGNYYRQGPCVCIVQNLNSSHELHPVDPDEFRSLAEKLGPKLVRENWGPMGGIQQHPANMKQDDAKVLLKAAEKQMLSNVRGLVSFPVLTVKDNKAHPHLEGYDEHSEILVKPRQTLPPLPPLADAVNTLDTLFKDFSFQAPSDKSRALSMFLTMALTTGKVMQTEVPMFYIEADKSATGKGYMVDLLAAIFDLDISYVLKHEGRGAGGQDESFYAALARGNPLVLFDNWRGKLESAALESYMTARSGLVSIRLPYQEYRSVDPRYYTLALTSNGCELTPDQANRTIFIRLRKQPDGYPFQNFPEGSLLEHVRANSRKYLAAVYAIASEWINAGCPTTKASYNAYTVWARSLDWIVQNILKLPPLLDKMEEEKKRVASPAMTFLRQLAIAVANRKKLGAVYKATGLVEVAFEAGIPIPGLRMVDDDTAAKKVVGMVMGRLFPADEEVATVTVDVFKVTRFQKTIQRKDGSGGSFPSNDYVFEPDSPDESLPPVSTPPPAPVTPPPAVPVSSNSEEIESTD